MAIYVVMEAFGKPAPDEGREAVFVRDGFSLLAFLLAPFWLLWRRLWIEAVLVIAALFGLAALQDGFGIGASAVAGLWFLVALYVGLEGGALRAAALARRGWREWGVVRAHNRGDAEIRYVLESTRGEPAVAFGATSVAKSEPQARWPANPPEMGLFPYPGGR